MPAALGIPGARAAVRLAKVCEVAARDVDLSLTQYRLLVYLSEGSAPANALAERLIVSRPSVTALVDGLVERGLVERRNDDDDRRRINHVLTDEGRRVLTDGDRALIASLEVLIDRLEPAQAATVRSGLELLHGALDEALAEREAEKQAAGVPA